MHYCKLWNMRSVQYNKYTLEYRWQVKQTDLIGVFPQICVIFVLVSVLCQNIQLYNSCATYRRNINKLRCKLFVKGVLKCENILAL